jgi:hypothetical protein
MEIGQHIWEEAQGGPFQHRVMVLIKIGNSFFLTQLSFSDKNREENPT